MTMNYKNHMPRNSLLNSSLSNWTHPGETKRSMHQSCHAARHGFSTPCGADAAIGRLQHAPSEGFLSGAFAQTARG